MQFNSFGQMHSYQTKVLIRSFARRFGLDIRRHRPDPDIRRLRHLCSTYAFDTVIDVGANVGQYGRKLRLSGYNGRIISFEPLVSAHKKLTRVAQTDSNWLVPPPLAIGASESCVAINISGNSVSSSLLPMLDTHRNAAPASEYVGKQQVTVVPLDSAVACYLDKKASVFLKIDTQGYETSVLRGATATLLKARLVQLEMSIVPLYDGQKLFREVLNDLTMQGFELCDLTPAFSDKETGQTLQVDGLFVRSDGRAPRDRQPDRPEAEVDGLRGTA